jgi:hypothetical protein
MLDPKVEKQIRKIHRLVRKCKYQSAKEEGDILLEMASGNRAIVEFWVEEFVANSRK